MVKITHTKVLTMVTAYFNRLNNSDKNLFQSDLAAMSGRSFQTFKELWEAIPSKPDNSEYVYYVHLAANVKIKQRFAVEEVDEHLIIHI